MPWVVPAIAAAGAAANLGAGLLGSGANNRQAQIQAAYANAQLQQAQNNQNYQRAVQAMVNQRAIAGTQDTFGTSVQYDPTTNTWVQQLGPLPKAADTAAMNANMVRNTTDLMQQELANRVAMQRAAQAGPAADTAMRNLANFQPMTSDQLTGLLTQQGVEAARQAYDPLRADTLRAVARTGTAAGPVLRQLGLGEAQNLRNTLIDAQIQGMQNVAGINTANYGRLANAAQTETALATPQLGQQNLGQSASDQLLQQLTANRAQWAPSSTAQGAYGTNMATSIGGQATGTAMGAVPNQNLSLQQSQNALRDLGSFASGTGPNSAQGLLQAFGLIGPDQSGQQAQTNTNTAEAAGGTPSDFQQQWGVGSNQYVP